jgi:hypothetical protein
LNLYAKLKDRIAHPSADNIIAALKESQQFEAVLLSPQAIASGELRDCCCVACPGGSVEGQSNALGKVGRQAIREFVANGGGYLGVCAGGFLAASHYNSDMSLRLLRASCVMSNANKATGRLTKQERRKPLPWMRGKRHCNVKVGVSICLVTRVECLYAHLFFIAVHLTRQGASVGY